MQGISKGEQPFPDSWIATTAAAAMGLLIDIASDIILGLGEEGVSFGWPGIREEIKRWSVGYVKSEGEDVYWSPCEALVRIACRELSRFCSCLEARQSALGQKETIVWADHLCDFYTSTLSKALDLEKGSQDELLQAKLKSLMPVSTVNSSSLSHSMEDSESFRNTPFGKGRLIEKRMEYFTSLDGAAYRITTDVIKLEFGMLYSPVEVTIKTRSRRNGTFILVARIQTEFGSVVSLHPSFCGPKNPARWTDHHGLN